ncbi:unnamed protein product [Spodoptera littoralis]|uniref:Uncharacterized protein n=1 Tax=Spodoptera littoralis TaxID=7109 RepID=A0A9P0N3A7_SPOLI|nr:unnamed protein product [Spodoptera littoralis]CAH1638286.1 unnamed protein product [Spodoptera littoralis]
MDYVILVYFIRVVTDLSITLQTTTNVRRCCPCANCLIYYPRFHNSQFKLRYLICLRAGPYIVCRTLHTGTDSGIYCIGALCMSHNSTYISIIYIAPWDKQV